MPKAFPVEFRRDVVAVARKSKGPSAQIAKDFGISDACLHNWLKRADVEDGLTPGVTQKDALELREAKKRIRLLEQEAEVMRRAVVHLSRVVNQK
jgi:transposase